MSRDEELISRNTKFFYIKFYSYKPKHSIANANPSSSLRKFIKYKGYTHVEYGFNFKTKTTFLRFNTTGDGLSLLNDQNQYKRIWSANRIVNVLLQEYKDIDFSIPFYLEQIEPNIFSLNKIISLEGYKNKEMLSVKWLLSEEKEKISKEEKELWVKFYKIGFRSVTMRISTGLKSFAEHNKLTHIEFGFTRKNNSIFVKFNNTGRGSSLLTSNNEYKSTGINAKLIANHLEFAGVNLEFKSSYFLFLKEDFTFRISPTSDNFIDTESVQWLAGKEASTTSVEIIPHKQLEKSEKMQQKLSQDKMWIKFYRSSPEKGTLRISEGLLNTAYKNNMTHIQFGYSKKAKIIFLRLNKNCEGVSVLNKNKEYKMTGIFIKLVLFYFSAAGFEIEFKRPYNLFKRDGLIYQVGDAGDKKPNIKEILWITNEDKKYKSRELTFSDSDQNEYSYLNKSSLSRNKKIKMVSPEDYETDYTEFENIELMNNNALDVSLEELKEDKNRFSSFIKISKKGFSGCTLLPSRKLLRICKKEKFTHFEIIKEDKDNFEVALIKLNRNGNGISLINSDSQFMDSFDITEMINIVNINKEIIELDAWYSAEKITDSQFEIKVQLYL